MEEHQEQYEIILSKVRTILCVCFSVHSITQANPTYILVRMCTMPMEESHMGENRTAQIWRSARKNILVNVAREFHVTRHVSCTEFTL